VAFIDVPMFKQGGKGVYAKFAKVFFVNKEMAKKAIQATRGKKVRFIILLVFFMILPIVGATGIDIVTINVGKSVLQNIDYILLLLSEQVGIILLQEIGINLDSIKTLQRKFNNKPTPGSGW